MKWIAIAVAYVRAYPEDRPVIRAIVRGRRTA